MKKLIIAEKSKIAQTIAVALGKYENHKNPDRTGYYENENYIITWAAGHLLTLQSVNDYLGKKTAWKDIEVPFVPQNFKYKIRLDKEKKNTDKMAAKQIEIIKDLISRNDIIEVIHCGDSDREGQIIGDILLKFIGNEKPVKRLWLPEQTSETIRNSLKNLKDNSEYLNLKNEGLARSYMDWLLGINLSVFLTVKAGEKLTVGRVLIPILKFVYDRDIKIRNFIPEDYYEVQSNCSKDGIDFVLTKKEKYSKNQITEAEEAAKLLNSNKATVSDVSEREKKKYPGKLFSLSTLQKHLSSKYKINFETSNEAIQKLYESGYITYPRTNTEYLSENEKSKVQEILGKLSEYNLEMKNSKKIFDSSMVESHSAIIITTKLPDIEKDFSDETEKTVYQVVFNRFISNFLVDETILSETAIKINVGEEEFTLKGETILKEGFLKYEPQKIENKLPKLSKDEIIEIDFKAVKKQTSKPNHVTESELESFLENPFRTEKTTEEEEYQAILSGTQIGTTATRTEIVSNAIKYKYISRQKGSYYLEPLGERIINVLDKLKINLYKDKTVEFSLLLKKVNKNELNLNDVILKVTEELKKIVNTDIEIEKAPLPEKESFGKCPICGKDIYKGKTKNNTTNYYCSGYKDGCTFTLWEQMKHFNNILKITDTKAKKLIEGKEVLFKLKSFKGTDYEAYLKLKINGKYVNFEQTKFKEKKEKK